jgi:hypothetical protein
MSNVEELKDKAKELKENEVCGCGDGFVKADAQLVKERSAATKDVDPKLLFEKAKALKDAGMLGCGDGFVRGVE